MANAGASYLLERVCGKYLDGINTSNVQTSFKGLWDGKVSLSNLSIKTEALDALQLPIVVTRSHVGKVTVAVPWKNINTSPAAILIDELYVLAKRRGEYDWSKLQEEALKSHLELKLAQLETMEMAREQSFLLYSDATAANKDPDWISKLGSKVLENLRVSISRIHVCFEEDNIATAGITLESLTLLNSREEETIYNRSAAGMKFKVASLQNASVYCDSHMPSFRDYNSSGGQFRQRSSSLSRIAWIEYMRNGIPQQAQEQQKPGFVINPITTSCAADSRRHNFVLFPTSGTGSITKVPKAQVFRNAESGGHDAAPLAHMTVTAEMPHIALALSASQVWGHPIKEELIKRSHCVLFV